MALVESSFCFRFVFSSSFYHCDLWMIKRKRNQICSWQVPSFFLHFILMVLANSNFLFCFSLSVSPLESMDDKAETEAEPKIVVHKYHRYHFIVLLAVSKERDCMVHWVEVTSLSNGLFYGQLNKYTCMYIEMTSCWVVWLKKLFTFAFIQCQCI